MVFAGIAIGFMGWGVWAHHMFASGIGPWSVAAFSVSTMFIAVPTGIKIFNWVGTMVGGKLKFEVPMLYAVAAVAMFTIGGLSGVTHAVAPADTQQTDTYYIVAHFHYVIFGGGVLGLFAGLYFWWPKVFGYRLQESWGKANFWMMLVGFNLTFAPMHILGLQGMSRRYYTYDPDIGFDEWNLVVSIGALILGIGSLLFVHNAFSSHRKYKKGLIPAAGPDPWDARSIEWMIQSPPPEYNFDPDPRGPRARRVLAPASTARTRTTSSPASPRPKTWPRPATRSACTCRRRPTGRSCWLPASRSLGYGLIYHLFALGALGALIIVVAMYGWAFEPPDDPNAGHGHGHDDDHHDESGDGSDGDNGAAAELPARAETDAEEVTV